MYLFFNINQSNHLLLLLKITIIITVSSSSVWFGMNCWNTSERFSKKCTMNNWKLVTSGSEKSFSPRPDWLQSHCYFPATAKPLGRDSLGCVILTADCLTLGKFKIHESPSGMGSCPCQEIFIITQEWKERKQNTNKRKIASKHRN